MFCSASKPSSKSMIESQNPWDMIQDCGSHDVGVRCIENVMCALFSVLSSFECGICPVAASAWTVSGSTLKYDQGLVNIPGTFTPHEAKSKEKVL